mgnify:CR=1 FL=1
MRGWIQWQLQLTSRTFLRSLNYKIPTFQVILNSYKKLVVCLIVLDLVKRSRGHWRPLEGKHCKTLPKINRGLYRDVQNRSELTLFRWCSPIGLIQVRPHCYAVCASCLYNQVQWDAYSINYNEVMLHLWLITMWQSNQLGVAIVGCCYSM